MFLLSSTHPRRSEPISSRSSPSSQRTSGTASRTGSRTAVGTGCGTLRRTGSGTGAGTGTRTGTGTGTGSVSSSRTDPASRIPIGAACARGTRRERTLLVAAGRRSVIRTPYDSILIVDGRHFVCWSRCLRYVYIT